MEEGGKGRTRLDLSYFFKKIKYLMSGKTLGRESPGVQPPGPGTGWTVGCHSRGPGNPSFALTPWCGPLDLVGGWQYFRPLPFAQEALGWLWLLVWPVGPGERQWPGEGGGCWGASRVVGQPFPGGCSGRTRSHLLFWLQSLFAQLLGGTLGFWHSPHFPSQTLNPVLFPQPNAVGLWQKRH